MAVVVAAAGYPEAPRMGDQIAGIEAAREAGALVFCAGVAGDPGANLMTAGGRVLAVVGQGATPDAAIESAYAGVAYIGIPGMQVRRDIGRTALPVGGSHP